MAELIEIKNLFEKIESEIEDMYVSADIANIRKEIEEKNDVMNDPGFWDNPQDANEIVREANSLKNRLQKFTELSDGRDDLEILIDMLDEDYSAEESEECMRELEELKRKVDAFEIETLLSGEYDENNAVISIHPGAGGTESQDWAQMLMRMFVRFCEKRNFKVEILDEQAGDVAGLKSVTMLVKGEKAYGYLRGEKGVHRLVRISPFDSNSRRHTSFASIDVEPELDEDINIEIDPKDLKIDTYRSGGAGGQHVNKTDSAVRITHLPTKIVVSCQNERSQFQNKDTAMKILKGKLYQIMMQEHKDKIDEIKGDYGQIAWGNQIRSYVFHPYTMVKDHRTKAETGNIQAVMDGDLDMFIDAYLKQNA